MSTIASFTPEEQSLIRDIIPLTGFAVAVAGNSGIIGTFKEAAATAKGLGEAAAKYPQNELIQSLLKDFNQNRPTMPKYNPLEAGIQEKIKGDALAKTRQVITLLAQKATPQEVTEFKQWILAVSENVANAAKEGGFLGIGGERVSAAEKAVLSDLQSVLSA
ncbi:MAG: hypothetical protein FJ147_22220 [Deltaproteobacteria bacterium]|nr:hypothetical protein [Deltaproteobacteria bacterium]